jgi:hypothetical integral membrane protein (TIGR02206 family)
VIAEAARQFVLFGPEHLFILGLTFALPLALSSLVRVANRPPLTQSVAAALAGILLVNRVYAIAIGVWSGRIHHWPDALPMHLCDWASIAVMIALVWGGQLPYELAYLWGLAGTFQAVLTPDLADQFPSPFFITFFVDHCGIIVSVLFLTWGMKRRPRTGSVVRVFLWSQVYLAAAGLVDWSLGTDYGYLRSKPVHSSLLDYFGPWPWYILVLEVLSLVFFTVFYAPFWLGNRKPEFRQSRVRETDEVN